MNCKDCVKHCTGRGKDRELNDCSGYKEREIQTNADRLRAMADEELANWLGGLIFPECQICPALYENCEGWTEKCESNLLAFMRKEAER